MSPRVILSQISPTAWEHPSEKAAYDAVRRRGSRSSSAADQSQRIRGEEKIRQWMLGDAVRVGPAQRPQLYALYLEVLQTLDWPEPGNALPELYVAARGGRASGAFGGARPFVVLPARPLDMLEREEQRFLVGRAVAQVISNRLHRRESRFLFDCANETSAFDLFRVFGGGRTMSKWGSSSELSDDRGALLSTQDIDAALMTMLKLAGGAARGDSLNVESWLDQHAAEEASGASAAADAVGNAGAATGATSPASQVARAGRIARRALELQRWSRSAEYSLILSGAYVRRGQEPVTEPAAGAGGAGAAGGAWFAGSSDVRSDAREAVNAVGDVIDKAADVVGDVVTKAADALGDVIKGTGEGSVGDVVNRARDAFRDAFKAASSAAKAAEEQMGEAWRGAGVGPDAVVVDYESPAADAEGGATTGATGGGNPTDPASGPTAAPV